MNDEKNAVLEQSIAMNNLVIDLLNQKKKDTFRLWVIIIILAAVNLIEVGLFVWYENQFETIDSMQTTTTNTTTENVEQDAESGNNIYQAGENANYNEGGGE